VHGFITHDKRSSPCRTLLKYILIVIPMFAGWKNLMALSGMLFRFDVETGSENVKLAAAQPDVPACQFLNKKAKKLQRLSMCFP
jgi:hypothetical protein